jgi:hypothetical protein
VSKIDQKDQARIELLHSLFCDRHGVAVIALQDASYELGRERGVIEGNANALSGLRDLYAVIEQILEDGHMNQEDLARLRFAYDASSFNAPSPPSPLPPCAASR